MKTIKLLASALAVTLALATTSCLGNSEPDQPNSWTAWLMPNANFSAVKDVKANTWKEYAGGTVSLAYDFDRVSMQLTVQNAQIASNKVLTFSLPYMTYNVATDGTMVLDQKGPFTVSGTNGVSYKISDVYVTMRTPANAPAIVNIKYNVDENYQVQVMPIYNYYSGITEIQYPDAGNVSTVGKGHYTTQQTYYNVALDYKSMKADLYLFQTRFAENMPNMDLIFKSVPFTLGDNGVEFISESLTPDKITKYEADGSITSVPEPNFNITGLAGTMTVAKKLTFEFDCKMGKAKFSGNAMVDKPSAE